MRFALVPVIILSALTIAGCGGSVGGGGVMDVASADLANGKRQFVSGCASCHTLADAGAQGKIGPNLDDAFAASREQGFSEETFANVVHEQIRYPGIGLGMPANIVTGEDAEDVAAYVARYAGNPGIPPSQALPADGGGAETGGGGEAGGAPDGAAIFSENCASCHTLAAAGATGTIGPNLDDAKPPQELVVERVTNGIGAMPSFKDQLSEAQIDAVAEYVSQNAGS